MPTQLESMGSIGTILLVIVAVLLIWLLLKILKTPLKWALKLLLNAACGFVALFILNLLGEMVGASLDMTWLNAIIIGVLGIPGVVLLIIVKYLL